MTHTARQIMDDMTYAHVTQSIAVIYGASGVGKSEALRHYASHNPNVWMVTASPCRSTLTECLYELAMELGMEQAPRLRGPLARAVRRRLVGTEGLIVIDEADHLDYPTLEELRILQEEVGIGLVLVGNNKIYTQLTGGRRNEDFARLFSRIAKRRGIHKTKQNDVKAISDAWAITGQGEPTRAQVDIAQAAVDGSEFTRRMVAYWAAHDEWLGTQHEYTVLTVVPPVPPRAMWSEGCSSDNKQSKTEKEWNSNH